MYSPEFSVNFRSSRNSFKVGPAVPPVSSSSYLSPADPNRHSRPRRRKIRRPPAPELASNDVGTIPSTSSTISPTLPAKIGTAPQGRGGPRPPPLFAGNPPELLLPRSPVKGDPVRPPSSQAAIGQSSSPSSSSTSAAASAAPPRVRPIGFGPIRAVGSRGPAVDRLGGPGPRWTGAFVPLTVVKPRGPAVSFMSVRKSSQFEPQASCKEREDQFRVVVLRRSTSVVNSQVTKIANLNSSVQTNSKQNVAVQGVDQSDRPSAPAFFLAIPESRDEIPVGPAVPPVSSSSYLSPADPNRHSRPRRCKIRRPPAPELASNDVGTIPSTSSTISPTLPAKIGTAPQGRGGPRPPPLFAGNPPELLLPRSPVKGDPVRPPSSQAAIGQSSSPSSSSASAAASAAPPRGRPIGFGPIRAVGSRGPAVDRLGGPGPRWTGAFVPLTAAPAVPSIRCSRRLQSPSSPPGSQGGEEARPLVHFLRNPLEVPRRRESDLLHLRPSLAVDFVVAGHCRRLLRHRSAKVKPVRWFSSAKDRRNTAVIVDQYLAALRSSSPVVSRRRSSSCRPSVTGNRWNPSLPPVMTSSMMS
uniref:Uncharacterized protein n=1 Tax=Oryza sativa subsp. japonica TaxID=39947 RepID=Q6H5Q9_ORYSJ|nr:hypothetical protein [Oryza sativa Japonica Group]